MKNSKLQQKIAIISEMIKTRSFPTEKDHFFFTQSNDDLFENNEESLSILQRNYLFLLKENNITRLEQLSKHEILVSFTSYPRRIKYVPEMLNTIFKQTMIPDRIIMWHSEEEFPEKLKNLPPSVNDLIQRGRLEVHWCENIKAHKKYLFAMKEFSEDIIITLDDDLLYERDMIEKLFVSYLRYPDCISAIRTHVIGIDENNHFLPYNDWIDENNLLINYPSMELFATNGAGTLFPPHLCDRNLLDIKTVQTLCPLADDLWLKTMEILSGIPTVQVDYFNQLNIILGSQEETLFFLNKDNGLNDIQLQNIKKWADSNYSENILENSISNYANSKYPLRLYKINKSLKPYIEKQIEKTSIKKLILNRINTQIGTAAKK